VPVTGEPSKIVDALDALLKGMAARPELRLQQDS
jgi:hypothetical protein